MSCHKVVSVGEEERFGTSDDTMRKLAKMHRNNTPTFIMLSLENKFFSQSMTIFARNIYINP
jgi:hypothetical protein